MVKTASKIAGTAQYIKQKNNSPADYDNSPCAFSTSPETSVTGAEIIISSFHQLFFTYPRENTMKPLRIAIAVIALFVVWYGCTTTPTANTTATTTDTTTATLCFSKDVQPIFQSNCAVSGCHDSQTRSDGYDLSSYSGIMRGVKASNANSSVVYTITASSLGSRRMPPSPRAALTDAQRAIIANWINAGAQNTTCN